MKSDGLKKSLLGKKYTGVELFSSDAQEKIAVLEVVQKKDELSIQREDIRTFNDATLKSLDNKTPYFLTVNTNLVIQKEVGDNDPNDSKLLQKHFPNLNFSEFYYQIWRLQTKSIISICRKSHIEEVLTAFRKNNIPVINLSLGNSNMQLIRKYSEANSITTNIHTVAFTGNESILTKTTNAVSVLYHLNGLEIRNTQLLPFASIVSYLSGTNNSGELQIKNKELEDSFLQSRLFRKVLTGAVYFLLVVLLVNFLVFNSYFKANTELDKQIESVNSSNQNTTQIKKRVAQKELYIEEYFHNATAKKSGKIASITRLVPGTTTLTTLHFNPKETKNEDPANLLFKENTISISGTSNSTADFTKWIGKLESLDFVSKVNISKYGKNEENRTLFELQIEINENKQ
jgi:Tfp pilus assembly protein PilN